MDALTAKAQRYAEKMLACSRDGWEFALWSSLTLEFLLRADLADYSPALLADPGDPNNLISALGFEPTAKRFVPKSISIAEVIDRLASLMPNEFTSELTGFAKRHTAQRNSELHSGHAAFEGVKPSTWLPLFYKTCEVVLEDMGLDLSDLVGKEEAAIAAKLIATLADDAAKAVKGAIAAHEKVWSAKDEEERKKLSAQAALWATRQLGHRVNCPACKGDALVHGEATSPPQKTIKGDVITEKQEHLPSKFECIACGLKIAGLSQLSAAGLGDVYVQTQTYDAGEYYAPTDEPNYAEYEDDNNEPM
jgi:hypothetical protein